MSDGAKKAVHISISVAVVVPCDVIVRKWASRSLQNALCQRMVTSTESLRVPIYQELLCIGVNVDAATSRTRQSKHLIEALVLCEFCISKLRKDVCVVPTVVPTTHNNDCFRIFANDFLRHRLNDDLNVLEDAVAVKDGRLNQFSEPLHNFFNY